MKSLFLVVLASSLFAAGCAVKDVGAEPTVTDRVEAVPTGAGCTLLHPMTWTVAGRTCHEAFSGSQFMADGTTYTATGVGGGVFGVGSTTVRCSNGSIITIKATCRAGSGGGEP